MQGDEEVNENYFVWYMRTDVHFEIIKFLQLREMMFYKKGAEYTFRYMRCHNVQTFALFLKNAGAFRHTFNIYNSVATYRDGIDWFGYDLLRRDKDAIDSWRLESHKHMTGYDFFIDIDAPSFDEVDVAKASALIFWDLLTRFNVRFECRYSGMGFHFVIPSSVLPKKKFSPYSEDVSIYQYLRAIARKLKENVSNYIDTSIYDERRVLKTPYTLAVYDEGEYVCLPMLMRDDVRLFDVEQAHIDNWRLRNVRGRGTVVFNRSGTSEDFLRFVSFVVEKWGELDYGQEK